MLKKIYEANAAFKAVVEMYLVSLGKQADLFVCRMSSSYQAGNNNGKWFFYLFD